MKQENVSAEQLLILLNKQDASKTPSQCLSAFCQSCWGLGDVQDECFNALEQRFASLSFQEKCKIIPELVQSSKTYPRLVYLAKQLFDTLDKREQECVNVPMIFWTMNTTKTMITQEEYLWRVQKHLPCHACDGVYTRPCQALDIMCYDKVIAMIAASGSKALIFTEGWTD